MVFRAFQKLFTVLSLYLLLLNYILILKMLTETFLRITFSDWSMFSSVANR
jgi:hypothetical protein